MAENVWVSGMEAVREAASVAGFMLYPFATVEAMANVIIDATRDDPLAGLVAPGVGRVLGELRRAPSARPVLCACCGRPVRWAGGEFAIVIGVPEAGDRTQSIGMAICFQCAETPQKLNEAGFEALRRIWPDLRSVIIQPGSPRHA